MKDTVDVEIDVVLSISSSGKAMKVRLSDTGKDVWIPISVIDYDECDITDVNESGTLVLQRWFAVKEGIINDD